MKYIVEVEEPVPSNLDEIASKVAAAFHITDAKAMALLRRAPGAMTKAVSEREADVVAGIFERAGLRVVRLPAEEDAGPLAGGFGSAETAAGEPDASGAGMPSAPPPVEGAEEWTGADAGHRAAEGTAAGGAFEDMAVGGEEAAAGSAGAGAAGAPPADDEAVWERPLEAGEDDTVDRFSRRDDFDVEAAGLAWEEGGPSGAPGTEQREADAEAVARGDEPSADADVAPEVGTVSREGESSEERGPGAAAAGGEGPAPGEGAAEAPAGGNRRQRRQRAQAAMAAERTQRLAAAGRSAERGAGEARLRRGGIRRSVAWTGVLPPLLSLLAMGVAMVLTVVPVAQDQQASQAADAAAAQAATMQALTGGLPLDSQTVAGALPDLASASQTLLRPRGATLMAITDANGAPLAGWAGGAGTLAQLPAVTRQAISDTALAAEAGQSQEPAPGFVPSVRRSWSAVKAALGGSPEATVLRGAPVMGGGRPVGAVVVGVPPVSGVSRLATAFGVVLLVGLAPLLLGILMAAGVNGGLRRKAQYLLEAGDRIGRGEVDEPVTLRSRDELGQLAIALERVRLGMAALQEHRRQHR